MKEKIRIVCAVLLIVSMLILSFFKWQNGDWQDAMVGVLYSAANVIIFII